MASAIATGLLASAAALALGTAAHAQETASADQDGDILVIGGGVSLGVARTAFLSLTTDF